MTEIIVAQDAPVLVAFDIAKARHEVLIAVPDKKRRRRLTICSATLASPPARRIIKPTR